jgi:hypothetical protein
MLLMSTTLMFQQGVLLHTEVHLPVSTLACCLFTKLTMLDTYAHKAGLSSVYFMSISTLTKLTLMSVTAPHENALLAVLRLFTKALRNNALTADLLSVYLISVTAPHENALLADLRLQHLRKMHSQLTCCLFT